MIYLGQIDGVAVNQRHEHNDLPRRASGSRKDIQERRSEPQGVRDAEADERTEHPEEKTNQEHSVDSRTTVEFGRSGSGRSRYDCNILT